jgi:hypothetical protein
MVQRVLPLLRPPRRNQIFRKCFPKLNPRHSIPTCLFLEGKRPRLFSSLPSGESEKVLADCGAMPVCRQDGGQGLERAHVPARQRRREAGSVRTSSAWRSQTAKISTVKTSNRPRISWVQSKSPSRPCAGRAGRAVHPSRPRAGGGLPRCVFRRNVRLGHARGRRPR